MTICTCGHDHYGHASGGACMFGDWWVIAIGLPVLLALVAWVVVV